MQPDAVDVVFTGLDHGMEGEVEQDFERSLALADAMGPDVLLAYELNGVPLPPQHGFPLRLVVPGWYGMTNVKWLRRIRVTDRPFEGYQQAHGYRMRTDEEDRGTPLSRMAPRALMAPPGFPEFLSRRRLLRPGRTTLEGRAWSGWAPVSSVEVSVDGGATWNEAELQRTRPWPAWVRWSFGWDAAAPGEYELCCRARDEAGNAQPDEPPWNVGGYSNNAIQRVPVTVLGQAEPTGTSDGRRASAV